MLIKYVLIVLLYNNPVVRILDLSEKGRAGVGTGTIYHRDAHYSYIITSNHVIDPGTKLQVDYFLTLTNKGSTQKIQVLTTNDQSDLAILAIPAVDIIPLAISEDPLIGFYGKPVASYGCEGGKFPAIKAEEILLGRTLLSRPSGHKSFWVTTGPIISGRSGGPLIYNDRLIGVCRGGLEIKSLNTREALYSSLEEIRNLLDE